MIAGLLGLGGCGGSSGTSRKGYLDGRDLASVFLWLRPNELIWPYVVNNWLLGKDPPASDILYWNAGTTRMPAALHREFVTIATDNSLPEPGAVTVLGSPVDLSQITADSYLVAGIADHITPWAELLPDDTAARRHQAVRPLHERAHRLRSSTRPATSAPATGPPMRSRRRAPRSG